MEDNEHKGLPSSLPIERYTETSGDDEAKSETTIVYKVVVEETPFSSIEDLCKHIGFGATAPRREGDMRTLAELSAEVMDNRERSFRPLIAALEVMGHEKPKVKRGRKFRGESSPYKPTPTKTRR